MKKAFKLPNFQFIMDMLIIKTGALGDEVRTSFLTKALKEKYKKQNPSIYWFTDVSERHIFINNPYIFKVISKENNAKIKNHKFDLIINLEEDAETCKLASDLNPKKLIGAFINSQGDIDYTSDSMGWFNMSRISKLGKKKADSLKKKNKKTHRTLIAEMIKVSPTKYEPFLRLTSSQRKIASDFLRRYNLSRTDLIIGINTGSGERWPKELPIKETVKLISLLYKKYNAKILLFGGPNELERNKEIYKLY